MVKVYNFYMINILCPICKNKLIEKENSLICKNNHTFDKSKYGYTNLILCNQKNSKDPGDNKLMVNSRHQFLNKDYYLPLATKICEILNCYKDINVLDAGVGTGYYLKNIINFRKNTDDNYYGVDISKHAVAIASKENKTANLFVSSVYNLPFENNSFDAIICVFSPFAFDEYKRVLKNGGLLIVVTPLEKHLIEFRTNLYEDVKKVETHLNCNNLTLLKTDNLCYCKTLQTNQDINALLQMTPYFYRAPKEKINQLKNIDRNFNITFNFKISIYKK